MEIICAVYLLIIAVIAHYIEKWKKSNTKTRQDVSRRQENQESDRAMGTFIFLDALSQGWLLPPPEDTFPVDEEDYPDDYYEYEDKFAFPDEEDEEYYRDRDGEY